MGNRGILHDDHRRIIRTSRNRMWLICDVEFKGRRRTLMSPGTYTELFFLDEAVALAAGHRPCGECRRTNHRAFIAAASEPARPIVGARDLDARLHASRRAPPMVSGVAGVPDGVFVTLGPDDFRLIWDGAVHRWTPDGYVDPVATTEFTPAAAQIVTPALSVAALRHGYPVAVHPSATRPDRTNSTRAIPC